MKASTRALPQIRRALLNGDYPAGERLQAADLAADLGTSATVIREVLTQLAAEGLLTRLPNRGFFIPELDLQELADLTELRCTVEGVAARMAVQRGDLQWESELTAAHHALSRTPRKATSGGGYDLTWAAAHGAFHRKIVEGCGSEQFLRVTDNLAYQTDLYRKWSSESSMRADRDPAAEHRAILEAALARDGDLLAQRLRDHYELTARVLRCEYLAQHPELDADRGGC